MLPPLASQWTPSYSLNVNAYYIWCYTLGYFSVHFQGGYIIWEHGYVLLITAWVFSCGTKVCTIYMFWLTGGMTPRGVSFFLPAVPWWISVSKFKALLVLWASCSEAGQDWRGKNLKFAILLQLVCNFMWVSTTFSFFQKNILRYPVTPLPRYPRGNVSARFLCVSKGETRGNAIMAVGMTQGYRMYDTDCYWRIFLRDQGVHNMSFLVNRRGNAGVTFFYVRFLGVFLFLWQTLMFF